MGSVFCTLSVQLYSYATSVNSVYVSNKIINNIDNFKIKCLSYSKISAVVCVLYFPCLHFLFNLGKHVNYCEKILFSLLYLTLVTSCIIGPFLCCHLLYLIIYLIVSRWFLVFKASPNSSFDIELCLFIITKLGFEQYFRQFLR